MNGTARLHDHPAPRRRWSGVLVACGAALLLAGASSAPAPAAAQVLQLAQASNGISLAEATRMVRDQTDGQVLRAETRRDKGRVVHRIRVLTEDGRVRTWHVDAETGRIY